MGNCCRPCIGMIYKRRVLRQYTSLDVAVQERDVASTLVLEDDEDGLLTSTNRGSNHKQHTAVTENEKLLLRNKNYSALINSQKTFDDHIDKQLAEQEARLRREEEAVIEERRKRHKQPTAAQSLPAQNDSWPADSGDEEWNVAGGEQDFDQFLDSISRRKTPEDGEIKDEDFVSAYTPS